MERVGDDGAGFSTEFEASPPAVQVRAWGFWNVEVASSFGTKVREACRNRPAGTIVHLDVKALKPMREEGQRSFTSLLEVLPSLGIARTVISTSSQLTKLQLLRLAGEAVKTAQIQFT